MAQATKTRFDKDGVVYVRLRDAWYRLEGDVGEPVPEGFNPNELLTAEQLQAHIKAQAAGLSAESPKQRPPFAIGQVWRFADGQEATVVSYNKGDNTFLLAKPERRVWFYPDGKVADASERGAVEYIRGTERPRLEIGKTYKTQSGRLVSIADQDGSMIPFLGDDGVWYYQFGFQYDDCDHIVSLVEDEPAKVEQAAEEPKKNPPLAVGQIWRTRAGVETMIFRVDKSGGFRHASHNGIVNCSAQADGKDIFDREGYDLVEYLRETDRVRVEVGREYMRSDGKKVKIIKTDDLTAQFMDDQGGLFYQFSWCNGITLDKELPTPGDEVSYFSEDKWLSGWIVRGTTRDGGKTFLITKAPDSESFVFATAQLRIDLRSALPPRNIGDLWQRRDGTPYAINKQCDQNTSLCEQQHPDGDLVEYVGKAMAAADERVAGFVDLDDAISFVHRKLVHERQLTIVSREQQHQTPFVDNWFVREIRYLPTLALEIE